MKIEASDVKTYLDTIEDVFGLVLPTVTFEYSGNMDKIIFTIFIKKAISDTINKKNEFHRKISELLTPGVRMMYELRIQVD